MSESKFIGTKDRIYMDLLKSGEHAGKWAVHILTQDGTTYAFANPDYLGNTRDGCIPWARIIKAKGSFNPENWTVIDMKVLEGQPVQ